MREYVLICQLQVARESFGGRRWVESPTRCSNGAASVTAFGGRPAVAVRTADSCLLLLLLLRTCVFCCVLQATC